MGVKHTKVVTATNNPAYEVSKNQWNQDHANAIDCYNVMDYAATGDGATDDRVAIQAAIDDAAETGPLPAQGAVVYFPPGTYVVSSPGLTLDNGIRLVGAGVHASIIVGNANTGYTVLSTGSGLGSRHEVAWLQFQSGGATNTSIAVKGTSRANIHDCRFYGACATQIVLDHNNVAGSYGHRIQRNEIDCTVTAASVGIKLTNSQGSPTSGITSTVISDNWMQADTCIQYVNFAGGGHGSNSIRDNLMQRRTASTGTGIDYSANSNGDVIEGNYFEGFADCVKLASGGGMTTPHRLGLNYYESATNNVTDNNTNKRGFQSLFDSQSMSLNGRKTGRLRQNGTGSIANNGTMQLGVEADWTGFIWVVNRSNATGAMYFVRGGVHSTVELSDTGAAYSVTAGTSGINIYWSAGNSRYELENKTGAGISMEFFLFDISNDGT